MRIDLTPEQLSAVLDVIGERVSATGESGTPLAQAEFHLDLALMAHEETTNESRTA